MEGVVGAVGDQVDDGEHGDQAPLALRRVEEARQRDQDERRQQRRDDVADVDREADRFALRAGRAERGEEVGDQPEEGDAAEPADQLVAAGEDRQQAGGDGADEDQRPERAEGARAGPGRSSGARRRCR